ncbi:unnamed protein product [Tilletia controversa]|nr:unnamed protein product [Tilletia controversa]
MLESDIDAFISQFTHLNDAEPNREPLPTTTHMPIVDTTLLGTHPQRLVVPTFAPAATEERKHPQRSIHHQQFVESPSNNASTRASSITAPRPRNNFFHAIATPIHQPVRLLTSEPPAFPFFTARMLPYGAMGSLMQRSPDGIMVREFIKEVIAAFHTIAITHPDSKKGAAERQDLEILLKRFKGRRRGNALLTEMSTVIHFEGVMVQPHRAVRPYYAVRLSSKEHPFYSWEQPRRFVDDHDQFTDVDFILPSANPERI